VATTGNLAFAAAAAKLRTGFRAPVLGIHCGTLDYRHNALRRARSRRLLQASHTFLFGEAELQPFRDFFALPETAVSVNQFGVDLAFWRPAAEPATGEGVFSVGNDGRRDFPTLITAAPEIGAPVRIVTRQTLPENLPANVTAQRGSWHGAELTDAGLRELYQNAACVAVPIVRTLQPSGQSVTLQAMACGRPVVLADFPGLWNRAALRDGENVLFYPAGDGAALARQVRRVLEDPALAGRLGTAARESVERHGSIGDFAQRILDQSEKEARP
jgi:glycosyltransferase involved in cell wall biosynthesis